MTKNRRPFDQESLLAQFGQDSVLASLGTESLLDQMQRHSAGAMASSAGDAIVDACRKQLAAYSEEIIQRQCRGADAIASSAFDVTAAARRQQLAAYSDEIQRQRDAAVSSLRVLCNWPEDTAGVMASTNSIVDHVRLQQEAVSASDLIDSPILEFQQQVKLLGDSSIASMQAFVDQMTQGSAFRELASIVSDVDAQFAHGFDVPSLHRQLPELFASEQPLKEMAEFFASQTGVADAHASIEAAQESYRSIFENQLRAIADIESTSSLASYIESMRTMYAEVAPSVANDSMRFAAEYLFAEFRSGAFDASLTRSAGESTHTAEEKIVDRIRIRDRAIARVITEPPAPPISNESATLAATFVAIFKHIVFRTPQDPAHPNAAAISNGVKIALVFAVICKAANAAMWLWQHGAAWLSPAEIVSSEENQQGLVLARPKGPSAVHVRSLPSLDGEIIGALHQNQFASVDRQCQERDGHIWCRLNLQFDGQNQAGSDNPIVAGWVALDLLDVRSLDAFVERRR